MRDFEATVKAVKAANKAGSAMNATIKSIIECRTRGRDPEAMLTIFREQADEWEDAVSEAMNLITKQRESATA